MITSNTDGLGTVSELRDMYLNDPAPLEADYSVEGKTVQLIALQAIRNQQQAIANQMKMDLQQQAMANGQGDSVAQQTERATIDLAANNIRDIAQNAGIGAALDARNSGQPPAQPAAQSSPKGINQIPSNISPYSGGGIIAFAEGTGGDIVSDQRGENIEFFETLLDREGVDDPQEREFLKAVYAQESSSGTDPAIWEDGEYKDTGAAPMGGMQVSDIAFRDIESEGLDRTTVEGNLLAGIRYGRKMYDQADGDPALAGAAYYGGPNAIDTIRSGGDKFDPDQPDFPTLVEYGEDIVSRMGGGSPSGIGVAQEIEESRSREESERWDREMEAMGVGGRENPYGTSKVRPRGQAEPEEVPVETETFGDYEQILRTSPNPIGRVGGGERRQDRTPVEEQGGKRGRDAREWGERGDEIAQEYADSMADGTIPVDSPFFGTTRIRRALASDNPALTEDMRRALVEKIGGTDTDWIDTLPPYELNPMDVDFGLGDTAQTDPFNMVTDRGTEYIGPDDLQLPFGVGEDIEPQEPSNVDKLKSVTMGQADTFEPPPSAGIDKAAGIDWARLQNALSGGVNATTRGEALGGVGATDAAYQLQEQARQDQLFRDEQAIDQANRDRAFKGAEGALDRDLRWKMENLRATISLGEIRQRAVEAEQRVAGALQQSLNEIRGRLAEEDMEAANAAWRERMKDIDYLAMMAALNDLSDAERNAQYAKYVQDFYESYTLGRGQGYALGGGGSNLPSARSTATISNAPSGT